MKRNGFIVLPGAILAGLAVVILLAACGSDSHSSATSGNSPACLPATLNHSAKLAGLPVDVSPAPETDTANPDTQISFLGVPATEIHAISVVGRAAALTPATSAATRRATARASSPTARSTPASA